MCTLTDSVPSSVTFDPGRRYSRGTTPKSVATAGAYQGLTSSQVATWSAAAGSLVISATDQRLLRCHGRFGRRRIEGTPAELEDARSASHRTGGKSCHREQSPQTTASRSSSRTGEAVSRSCSATGGRCRLTTGTTRCCSSCSRGIASSPMTAAVTDGPRRPATVTTWTTTRTTWPRSSSISTCTTPSTSATRPAAARSRTTWPGTARGGPPRPR